MLDMSGLARVLDVDRDAGLVKVEAGIDLRSLSETLWGYGLALENLGDIDKQTVSGAISTATHGTGSRFRNLSSLVAAVELVLADGTLVESGRVGPGWAAGRSGLARGAGRDRDGDAARDAGVHAQARRFAAPARRGARAPRRSRRRLRPLRVLRLPTHRSGADAAERTDRRPRRSRATPRPEFATEVLAENWAMGAVARLGRLAPSKIPGLARFVSSRVGRTSVKQDRSYRVFASRRLIRFTEMEYAIPRRHGAEAVPRVLDAAERAEPGVGFPIEVRFVAGDDADLSPAFDRDTCYIAVHQFEGMPWEGYFRAVEAIMDDYGGRPHWGEAPLPDRRDAGRALPALERVPSRARAARPVRELPQRLHGPRPRPAAERRRLVAREQLAIARRLRAARRRTPRAADGRSRSPGRDRSRALAARRLLGASPRPRR